MRDFVDHEDFFSFLFLISPQHFFAKYKGISFSIKCYNYIIPFLFSFVPFLDFIKRVYSSLPPYIFPLFLLQPERFSHPARSLVTLERCPYLFWPPLEAVSRFTDFTSGCWCNSLLLPNDKRGRRRREREGGERGFDLSFFFFFFLPR